MTALAADKQRDSKFLDINDWPVGASTLIYKGAGCMVVSGIGGAVPMADTANGIFIGVSERQYDNSSGSIGDIYANMEDNDIREFTTSGAAIATWLGEKVYAVDSDTVALVGTTTNDVLVGQCIKVISATKILVRLILGG